MFKSLEARASTFAVALLIIVPVVFLVLPGGASPDPNRCESINGAVVYEYGSAVCRTTPSLTPGAQPNVAIASGDNSVAYAEHGDNNQARATGDNSQAIIHLGSNDQATANGANSQAFTGFGDFDVANANGPGSSASAGMGSYNIATANGKNSNAGVTHGDHNTSTANGPNSLADVEIGGYNTSTADGNGSSARSGGVSRLVDGSNNTAIAHGHCTANALGNNLTDICRP